ncbi:MAG: VCBS repeat-containing protein, partial [Flavobacteriales bacterium]|nr:VCBS repeat-containing protein [Flavobacteriales bacterium]
TQQVGLAGWVPGYRMGMAFGDVDNDGDADLFLGSAAPSPDGPFQPRLLLFDAVQGLFVDATASSGDLMLPRVAVPIHAATMVDINADGWLDVWAVPATGPELLFVSNANGTFTECGVDLGLDPSPGDSGHAGLALLDYNNDGRLDVVVHPASAEPPRIYTTHSQDNRTLGVMLTSSSGPNVRDPAGRRVRVRGPNGTLLGSRHVSTGGGPGQDDSVVRFGLGPRANSVVSVEVRTFAGNWTSVAVPTNSVTAVRNGVMLPRTVEVSY